MNGRVLLVEPDLMLAQTYKVVLEREGFTVTHCGGAQDAIMSADTACPDVVVLELQLSGHSGIEFLYEFRSYPEWRDIPVIVQSLVSPSVLRLTVQQSRMLGIAAVLYKPSVKLRHLVEAVTAATRVTAQQ